MPQTGYAADLNCHTHSLHLFALSLVPLMQPPKRGSSDAAEAYYAALLQGAGGHRDARFRPVFVLGLPRSGSTLIEQILASHSQVRCCAHASYLARA